MATNVEQLADWELVMVRSLVRSATDGGDLPPKIGRELADKFGRARAVRLVYPRERARKPK